MRMDDSLKSVVSEAIDAASDTLHQLSKYIWENPELGLEEYKAHDYISKVLQDQGFTVTPHYLLQTAFRWVGCHYYTTLSSPDSLHVGCHYYTTLSPPDSVQVGCHYYTTLSPPDSLQVGRLS